MEPVAGGDGWTADVVFDGAQHGYSYDDIVFMPGHVTFEASSADLSTRLTRNISVKLPLVGSPSEAVTEAEMAVELALAGGIGFIHCNQSVQSQTEMVKRVKRHHNGFIYDLVTLSPQHTVADVDRVKATNGFSGIPITDTGELGGKILGIITSRDVDAIDDRSVRIQDVMTKQMVLGREGLTLAEAYGMMQQKKVGKLPIVTEDMCLTSMVSRGDWKRVDSLKYASRDSKGQLLVGAAVSADREDAWERALALIEAGADLVYFNTAGSGSSCELELIARLKAEFPQIEVVAGPVTACREAKFLCDAGADAVVVGASSSIGLGGECQSVGRPEATATLEIARYVLLNYGLPTIAQGSLRNSGQILKALGLGASAVMLDELLGSALQVRELVPYIASALRNGLCDLGIQNMPELHRALLDGGLKMECRSFFGQKQAEQRARDLQSSCLQYVQPCT